MTEQGRSAKEALACAKAIMTGMGRKAVNYIGEFNELMLYLEWRVSEEEKAK